MPVNAKPLEIQMQKAPFNSIVSVPTAKQTIAGRIAIANTRAADCPPGELRVKIHVGKAVAIQSTPIASRWADLRRLLRTFRQVYPKGATLLPALSNHLEPCYVQGDGLPTPASMTRTD